MPDPNEAVAPPSPTPADPAAVGADVQALPAVDGEPALAAAYAACALSIGASLAFFLTGVVPLPVLLYFPLVRRFGFRGELGELSMDYYGRSLLALLVGAALGSVVYLLCSRPGLGAAAGSPETEARPGEASLLRDRLALLAAYVVTAALLAAGLFAYQLGTRVPTPEPLPTAAQSPRI
jgi:hypothetical protein